jgi:hypothetical protein
MSSLSPADKQCIICALRKRYEHSNGCRLYTNYWRASDLLRSDYPPQVPVPRGVDLRLVSLLKSYGENELVRINSREIPRITAVPKYMGGLGWNMIRALHPPGRPGPPLDPWLCPVGDWRICQYDDLGFYVIDLAFDLPTLGGLA